jgi:hypothetical protein
MQNFALLYSVLLFCSMLICLEAGRRIGLKRASLESSGTSDGKKVVEGSFLGLFSLLLAFSFSGAISRFDHRRELIVEEANDIGTAYLRIDLLATSIQPRMRDLFRTYLDARLAVYQKLPDVEAARAELAHSAELQKQIWDTAVSSTRGGGDSHPEGGKLFLPALNSMIDITNVRTWAALTHPPLIIYALLFAVAMICGLFIGQSLFLARSILWGHMLAFALLVSMSMFVILGIEYPRMSFINIEKYDQALTELRASMK